MIMMLHPSTSTKLFFLLVILQDACATIVINEVADKSTTGLCDGSDWIELFNDNVFTSTTTFDLAGFVLHDDKGPTDSNAFTFPEGSTMESGEYLVICLGGDDPLLSPQFWIGGDDTVTLLDTEGTEVSTTGPLLDEGAFDVTYSLTSDRSFSYEYTTVPTPGAVNVLSPPEQETVGELRARLKAQNALGSKFFGMDENGNPPQDRFDEVLDLKLVMEEADYLYTTKNASYEVYRPFQSGKVLQRSDGAELLSLDSPGRLRPKGQSTLNLPLCLGIPSIPFAIDIDTTDKTQTLFGAGKVYLRNKLTDRSYMREWVAHRMLARFGLPHLRTRAVRFFINDEYIGLYDLMEAPDSEYVFARGFPDYDPTNHALYKVKTMSIGCGTDEAGYGREDVAEALLRMNHTAPYAFQRGEHRPLVPVRGVIGFEQCLLDFFEMIGREQKDAVLAYVRNDQDCGKMQVGEGIVDRDLGVSSWDPTMESFINTHLSDNSCSPGCAGSNLASEVDVTNFLKVFAVFATLLNTDSPLGNGNNYYLAQTGDGAGWKIVPYDLDNAASEFAGSLCSEGCSEKLVHWSIERPTCRDLEQNQLAGPLLTDPTLHAQYIEYVREFVGILANESFIEEMMDHALAIQADVTPDFWNVAALYDYYRELSPDAAEWNSQGYPFLAVLRARVDDITDQFDALDGGTFPRDLEEIEQWETCVDWRSDAVEIPVGWFTVAAFTTALASNALF